MSLTSDVLAFRQVVCLARDLEGRGGEGHVRGVRGRGDARNVWALEILFLTGRPTGGGWGCFPLSRRAQRLVSLTTADRKSVV